MRYRDVKAVFSCFTELVAEIEMSTVFLSPPH